MLPQRQRRQSSDGVLGADRMTRFRALLTGTEASEPSRVHKGAISSLATAWNHSVGRAAGAWAPSHGQGRALRCTLGPRGRGRGAWRHGSSLEWECGACLGCQWAWPGSCVGCAKAEVGARSATWQEGPAHVQQQGQRGWGSPSPLRPAFPLLPGLNHSVLPLSLQSSLC